MAIAPHYSSSDCHQGWTYQSGAFDLWFAMSWTSKTLAPDTRQRRFEAAGAPKDQVRQELGEFVPRGVKSYSAIGSGNSRSLSSWRFGGMGTSPPTTTSSSHGPATTTTGARSASRRSTPASEYLRL